MATCPFAELDVINGWYGIGLFKGGPLKIVLHTTEGGSYSGARSAYKANRSEPQFTVDDIKVRQHIDSAYGGRALKNAAGGVETNFDGAIQIEIVGYAGRDLPDATLNNLIRLLKWLTSFHSIPWVWPEGRPPIGTSGNRAPQTWDDVSGFYGHSQVPENDHVDPGFTDRSWWILNESMGAVSAPATGGVVYNPALQVQWRSDLACPSGGAWVLQPDGAIFGAGGAPYKGGANGKPYFAGRTADHLEPFGDGYTIVATSGERYDYP